jgi:NADH pyrophosphatase NudC (nudix superfamily)
MCGCALAGGADGIAHARLRCPDCGWTWYNPPVPVTLVLVTTEDGRVVYTRKRAFEPGRWSVVSGFIPCGERAEDAAVREVKEETGLDVEIVRFMGTHVYPGRPEQIVIAFHARVTGGELCAQDDIDEAEFGPPDVSRLRPGSTSHWLVATFLAEASVQTPR